MGFEVVCSGLGQGGEFQFAALGGLERVKSLGFKVEGGSRVSSVVGFGVECGVRSGLRV